MDITIVLRLIGLTILIAGFVLAWNPELVSSVDIPNNPFEAVERRIKWGMVIGLGILLIFHHKLQPWLLTATAVGASIVLGMLTARSIGIVLDGKTVKQFYWLATESSVFLVLAYLYYRQVS